MIILMILTLRSKVKKPYYKKLNRLVPEVNFVWNYINSLSSYMVINRRTWLSHFDINYYLAGATKGDGALRLAFTSLSEIAKIYVNRRQQAKNKHILRYRGNKSPGWIPFGPKTVTYKEGYIRYRSLKIKIFDSYGMDKFTIKTGNFSRDPLGDWYFNASVEILEQYGPVGNLGEVGIDMGLSTWITCSNGQKFETIKFFDVDRLNQARSKSKKHLQREYRAISRKRRDYLHKTSTTLAKSYNFLVVGDLCSKWMVKEYGNMAHDASFYNLKEKLKYKTAKFGSILKLSPEAKTTLTCHSCGSEEGPTGKDKLKIREWTCSSCGSIHDRDVNAAKNILALGRQSLASV